MSDATTYLIPLFALAFGLISIWVLLSKRLIVMITVVGIGSVVLSILFFLMDAPYAGAIELSVGAGLISVLFVIATGLSDKKEDGEDSK